MFWLMIEDEESIREVECEIGEMNENVWIDI